MKPFVESPSVASLSALLPAVVAAQDRVPTARSCARPRSRLRPWMVAMRVNRVLVALVPVLTLSGCVASTTYGRTYEPEGPLARPLHREGSIESIREVIHRTEGNPAGGAVAGSLVGALLGHALTGSGGGALVGAVGGAATGAAVSQGSSEQREYEVLVRFDDGSGGRVVYSTPPPWRAGDRVRQTARGLEWLGEAHRSQPDRPAPEPPSQPPPPPPAEPEVR